MLKLDIRYLMNSTTIAIVGGGANGVATFVHLVLKLIVSPVKCEHVKIVLIEKDREFGPGLAYGTKEEGHLLNTSAGLMGIFAEEPLHFVEWLYKNRETVQQEYAGIEIDANSYVPRHLYGRYLKATLSEYKDVAQRHNLRVSWLHDEVTDAEITDKRVVLALRSGAEVKADFAVLATGTPEPNNFPHLKESPQYVDFPWPSDRLLRKIPRDAAVSMLGTSLTAIDTIVTLTDNGHRGKLTLYSRNGLLPRVQTPFDVPFEREVLTLAQIRKMIREKKRTLRAKDLFRLFRAEAERVMGIQDSWKQFSRVERPHLELLKQDLELALKGESVFQNIAFSTRYLSFEAWKLLPEDQKVLFMKWFGAHWDINRHSMPPQNARKLLRLLESGQLTIKPHSSKVEWKPEEKKFYMYLEDGSTDQATYLVNATGTAKKIERMEIPLLQALLHKKQLLPYKAGGIKANPDTLQIIVPGKPQARLYGVGQLLNGELLDTNSVWFNVACVDRMTNDILHRLANGCI
ncbi:FAD/NAD(P)-binding protein [Pontibacter sp. SGAir0037]|uniref:FAD/NAD(P)-binding protein n=1 Tax=Pontibacter sp. SGAir0037 TaxID=2571030 RepID=UPI0010CD54B9|nr:FAD/NAD(P)-binding protein [Pontibacter sp. SGAir0037]QCR23178.1 hypothetical protein C1N53_13050 [Pontibacter sp. SGAir0037]